MPTDAEFANDLNLDASDLAQITTRLNTCLHFLGKIDTRLTRINSILQPSPPPITPELKATLSSIASLSERIFGTARSLNALGGPTDGPL